MARRKRQYDFVPTPVYKSYVALLWMRTAHMFVNHGFKACTEEEALESASSTAKKYNAKLIEMRRK